TIPRSRVSRSSPWIDSERPVHLVGGRHASSGPRFYENRSAPRWRHRSAFSRSPRASKARAFRRQIPGYVGERGVIAFRYEMALSGWPRLRAHTPRTNSASASSGDSRRRASAARTYLFSTSAGGVDARSEAIATVNRGNVQGQ